MPKITRLFSVAERVQIVELFCDCMEKKRLIPVFSFPNVSELFGWSLRHELRWAKLILVPLLQTINSFPKQMPALTSLHIATTFGQQMHWDVVALVSCHPQDRSAANTMRLLTSVRVRADDAARSELACNPARRHAF